MILLAEFYFDGGNNLRRVATEYYYSKASDSIGVKEFAGRITGRPTFRAVSGCIIWGNKTTTSIGDIEVTNVDGGISDWVNFDFRDSLCVLRMVEPGASYANSKIVQRCIIDDVVRDGQSIVVKLRGPETLLDRAIQTVMFDSATASENTEVIGNPVPILFGRCKQIEPVLISTQDLAYQMSDVNVTVDTVYSGGSIASSPAESPDDYATNDNGFVMLTQPSARITADGSARHTPEVVISSEFDRDSAWSSGVPVDWSVVSGPSSFSRVQNVGIRLLNLLSSNYPMMDAAHDAGYWHSVVGEIADMESGGIVIDFGDSAPYVVRRKGRFACIGKCGTGGSIQIRTLADSDVTIKFLQTHKFDTAGANYDRDDNLIRHMMIRGALKIDGVAGIKDVNVTSVSGYLMGSYIDDDTTVANVVQKALDSFCGFMYVDALGTIRLGQYARPSGTPTLTVSRLNMTRYPKRSTDLAPGLSTRVAAGRNWSPYTENELAGITFPNRPPFMAEYRYIKEGASAGTIDKVYSHALQANPIETIICDEDDAQAEADRICEIAQDKHPFWDIEFALNSVSDIASIRQGTIVLLDDEMFEDDNGKIAMVVEVEGQFGSNVYRVVTWGAENP